MPSIAKYSALRLAYLTFSCSSLPSFTLSNYPATYERTLNAINFSSAGAHHQELLGLTTASSNIFRHYFSRTVLSFLGHLLDLAHKFLLLLLKVLDLAIELSLRRTNLFFLRLSGFFRINNCGFFGSHFQKI